MEGLGVVLDVYDRQWQDMFTLLAQFKQKEGHCDVPYSHKEDGQNLRQWLGDQRKNKKKGTINATKEKKLEELGVIWDVDDQQWQDFYALLAQFKQREGHCNVPKSHKKKMAKISVTG